jgi:Pyruvate/2-oxoacid:ferredoxin oxidoreductase delta subunit
VALVFGKHLWGGTGRNILNPAVTGMFVLSIFFPLELHIFEPSNLLLPAMLLSVPFMIIRLFPGIGMITGMLMAMLLGNGEGLYGIMAYGVLFWGCLVITDPVTSTDKPVAGLVTGFLSGFLPLYIKPSIFSLSAVLLVYNGLSFLLGSFSRKHHGICLHGLKMKPAVRIRDGAEEMTDLTGRQPCRKAVPVDMEPSRLLQLIREKDVFGMGGAGFPTAEKLEAVIRSGAKEKYLIINGMECDPGLLHDKWLVKNRSEEIAGGIEILERLVSFKKIYCIAKHTEYFRLPEQVEMYRMPDRYPYGAEKLFVEKLLGINIPETSNPAQYGVLVLNVQTVLSSYEAVCCGEKSDTRFITVADMVKGTGQVVRVKLGERVSDIVEKTIQSRGITFVGGGVMQAHTAAEGEIVGKRTNFIAVGMLPKFKESTQCINCGLCRLCCPMELDVRKITDLVDKGKSLEALAYDSARCINCGICSYVCMAGRNLADRIPGKQ